MKTLILILLTILITSCKTEKVKYLTNGYLCSSMLGNHYNHVIHCEHVITGKKQDVIYNATNIVEVR